MKIIKSYILSEKTLEKDINKFIRDAKNGCYQYDYKYGQEGLKIVKAYFRMIKQELKKVNYAVAIICYEKILSFLFQREFDYFNYEDIISKFNIEKIFEDYFYCLIQNNEDIFKKYLNYLTMIDEYYFESVHKTIITNLSEAKLIDFFQKVEQQIKSIKKEDYCYYELIDILLEYIKSKNHSKYLELKRKYKDYLDDEF